MDAPFHAGSIIYQVSLRVQAPVASSFATWLAGHMREVASLPGFEGASWLEPDGEELRESAEVAWIVQYRLRDRESLDAYLSDHAARMREDGVRRFGDRFSAARAVYRVRDAT